MDSREFEVESEDYAVDALNHPVTSQARTPRVNASGGVDKEESVLGGASLCVKILRRVCHAK